jgi:hypothetical protein
MAGSGGAPAADGSAGAGGSGGSPDDGGTDVVATTDGPPADMATPPPDAPVEMMPAADGGTDMVPSTEAGVEVGGGDGGLVLLQGGITALGGGAVAGTITLEDDGFETFGPNCSADGTLCLVTGGLTP